MSSASAPQPGEPFFAPSLTLMIPAFNEAANLPAVLPPALELCARACRKAEVLVVDDGSSDPTRAVAERIAAGWSHPRVTLRILAHERNRGLTATLRTGFFAAQGEVVTWIPADGQIPIPELEKILRAYRGEELLLSTYRQRPDGIVRAVMSRTVRLLVLLGTGFSDRLEGPYLFKRALLDELDLVCNTSAGSIGLEIAAKTKALGHPLGSVEIECAPRLSGSSKVANLRNITSYLGEIWRIHRSMRSMRSLRSMGQRPRP
jgi:glycosyltransferase involved in cell wall biosynthesis